MSLEKQSIHLTLHSIFLVSNGSVSLPKIAKSAIRKSSDEEFRRELPLGAIFWKSSYEEFRRELPLGQSKSNSASKTSNQLFATD